MKYKLKLINMLGVLIPFWFLTLLFVGFSLSSIPTEAQLAKKGLLQAQALGPARERSRRSEKIIYTGLGCTGG